jgi:hypothetical protein
MTLEFLDLDNRIYALTNASDRIYSCLVTQIHEEQLNLPMEEQDHQPLEFLSGEFKGAQQQWTEPEMKGFAIIGTVTNVKYLLLIHDEFSILSDHVNLSYIDNPLPADPTLARHVVHKLQRWELRMYVFSYRREHVMGDLNYWTDLMSRSGVGWIADREHKEYSKMVSLFAQPHITSPDCDTVEFSSKKEKASCLCRYAPSRSTTEDSTARLPLAEENLHRKSMLVACE